MISDRPGLLAPKDSPRLAGATPDALRQVPRQFLFGPDTPRNGLPHPHIGPSQGAD
jgi:hypothetical protein